MQGTHWDDCWRDSGHPLCLVARDLAIRVAALREAAAVARSCRKFPTAGRFISSDILDLIDKEPTP